MSAPQYFIDNVQMLMLAHKWDEFALAERLGIKPEHIFEWWQGAAPAPADLVGLSEVFRVSIDRLLKGKLPPRQAADIRLLILDVDGVLTDGGMYYAETGDALKRFHTRDGRGILEVMKQGVEVAILSGSFHDKAIRNRAERLGIQRLYIGRADKWSILEVWMEELGLEATQVAFIGDDLNDLTIIPRVGLSACPANAADAVKVKADIVLRRNGGDGCVREFIEMLWDI